jgi:hypothetical protein
MTVKLRLTHNTKKRVKHNVLVAHLDGTFSVRIKGRWTKKVPELSQAAYLDLLRADRERLVLREFYTGRSVTGSRVIISRPAHRVEAGAL